MKTLEEMSKKELISYIHRLEIYCEKCIKYMSKMNDNLKAELAKFEPSWESVLKELDRPG